MRYSYSFKGVSICRDAFLKIYDVSRKVLSNIMTHMKQNGAIPREHGNKGKKPVHALKFEEIENAVNFIKNYADEFGIPQPEAPRGSDGIPPIYLPASDTKKAIHQRYLQSCDKSHTRALKITSFEDVWLKCVPHIYTDQAFPVMMSARNANAVERRSLMRGQRRKSCQLLESFKII